MRTVSQDQSTMERALRAGQVRCPGCQGALRPWGRARSRLIRLASGGERDIRPRRARCPACRTTHVLLPDWMVARRAYSARVIRDVLAARDDGLGYRRIAAARKLPETTVRDWLRALWRPPSGVVRSTTTLGRPRIGRPPAANDPLRSVRPNSDVDRRILDISPGNTSSPQLSVSERYERPP